MTAEPARIEEVAAWGESPAEHLPVEAQAFVILVLTPQGKCRRKVYLSLHSAALAVQRAEGRGQSARLVLCRLEPVECLADSRDAG